MDLICNSTVAEKHLSDSDVTFRDGKGTSAPETRTEAQDLSLCTRELCTNFNTSR